LAGSLNVSLFGLAPGGVYLASPSPELLVRSYRTVPSLPVKKQAVCISVALSLGLPPLGVIQHLALWSSDFPQASSKAKMLATTRFTHWLFNFV